METSAAYHSIGIDEIDDRDDTGTDLLKFLGACALAALLGLGGLAALLYHFS